MWRAVDQVGDELDILVQKRRDKKDVLPSVEREKSQYITRPLLC